MNDFKMEILEILSEDARTSHKDMAKQLGCDIASITIAVREMEENGIIIKYHTVINHEKAARDLSVEALIEVKVVPQRDRGFDAIARRIYKFDEVRSVYLMSGSYDLMVLIESGSMKQVAFFVAEKLSTLDGVLSTATHFILKRYKDDGVIIDNEEDDRLVVTP